MRFLRTRGRLAALFAAAAMAVLTATMPGTATATGAGAQTVAPARVTDVAPDGGSSGVPVVQTIYVDFDSRMDTDTVTDTVSDTVFRDIRLKKKGARRALGVTDVYTFASDTWAGLAHKPLQPGTVYQVIV